MLKIPLLLDISANTALQPPVGNNVKEMRY